MQSLHNAPLPYPKSHFWQIPDGKKLSASMKVFLILPKDREKILLICTSHLISSLSLCSLFCRSSFLKWITLSSGCAGQSVSRLLWEQRFSLFTSLKTFIIKHCSLLMSKGGPWRANFSIRLGWMTFILVGVKQGQAGCVFNLLLK